jgi:hypothetical protein
MKRFFKNLGRTFSAKNLNSKLTFAKALLLNKKIFVIVYNEEVDEISRVNDNLWKYKLKTSADMYCTDIPNLSRWEFILKRCHESIKAKLEGAK